MEDQGHLPPFTLIRCESAPTSAPHSPCIKCLPRAPLPVSCQPWPGWLRSGPSAWARANTPPGLRAQGYRQMDRRGEMPSPHPPPTPPPPIPTNTHLQLTVLIHCQIARLQVLGAQERWASSPSHHTRARAWTPECGAARLGHPHPDALPGRKEVPRPPQLCVSLAHTPHWPHLAPSQASSGGSWQSGPSHTYRPQEVPTQHQDSPCG